MTADRAHCEGCYRTIEEIRDWSRADAAQRRAIWQRLLARAGLAWPPAPSPDSLTPAEPPQA